MTIVKNLAFIDKKKLKSLNSFVESGLELNDFHDNSISFLHHLLPFKLKFLNETFVAIENNKIKGLITINKAGEKRIKISRLLLEENSSEVGKMLVNCVVTLFLSKGAESFYVVVDNMNLPLLSMFKDGLGFKSYAKEIIYKIENKETTIGFDEVNFEHITKMNKTDAKSVEELINSVMIGYKKLTFLKTEKEIKNSLFSNNEQYIIQDKSQNKTLGYFSILKLNKGNYLLEFVINSTYEGYFSDIIKFTKSKLMKNKNFKNLFVKLKSYYQNFDSLNEMFNIEYIKTSESEILVKDYLVPKKEEFTFERMIFNDATPAF